MIAFALDVAAVLALGTLGYSGLAHLKDPSMLGQAMEDQRVVRPRLLAGAVIVGELTCGLGGLALLVFRAEDATLLLTAAGALYLAFIVYTAILFAKRPGSHCGCSAYGDRVNGGTVVRAGILFICSALAAATGTERIGMNHTIDSHMLSVYLAGTTFGVILWNLPASLQNPLDVPLVQNILGRKL